MLHSIPESLHTARAAAAIMLKNDIKARYSSIAESSKVYVRSHIIQGLNDPNFQMRSYCGTVITELIRQGGVLGWRDLLPNLVSMISNESGHTSVDGQDGAMGALLKICEDNKKALNKIHERRRPSDYLVPNLIEITSSPLPRVRANAVAALNVFLESRAEAVVSNLDGFLERLFSLAHDSSEDVKKGVCRAIVRSAELSPEKIVPHLQDLVRYLLEQQQNEDDSQLALEAAEFWLTAGEEKNLQEHLGPYLSEIVPVLLQCMVYTEDDVIRLEEEAKADDAEAQDRQEDIKPSFATKKPGQQDDGDSSEEGEIEDDEGFSGDDPEEQWNLRKCSAAALDVLATVFKKPMFDITLPYLKENLSHPDWPKREAGVLTIGAISEGCIEIVSPHLPDLIPFLINLLDDQAPVVRKITCWSIGRYSSWAAALDEARKKQFFLPIMDGLLKHMLDPNKRVQEAAASAFLTLMEHSQAEMGRPEYLQVIIQQYNECFAKYMERNMLILLDGVAQLAGIIGAYRHMLPNPDLIGNLMPALANRLSEVSDLSSEIFPLLESLTCMANAMGTSFTPWAGPIWDRCMNITIQNLKDSAQAAEGSEFEPPDKDYLITSLDLLGAMVQALDMSETLKLLARSQLNLFELLPLCLNDANMDAEQSAFALLGDCAIHIYGEIRPHLSKLMPIIISKLDREKVTQAAINRGYPVMNNACWSCGEIAIRAGSDIASFTDELLKGLFDILTNIANETLRENAAIALGRVSGTSPERVAPHLDTVAGPLLSTLQKIQTDEKVSALNGFSKAVMSNPQALGENFPGYLVVVSRAQQADPVVQQVRWFCALSPISSILML